MCKLKGGCKRENYDMEIKLDGPRGHYHFQIKGLMDKGEHNEVEMKWWMQKEAL